VGEEEDEAKDEAIIKHLQRWASESGKRRELFYAGRV
jgi:hypothetical protein